MDLPSAAAASRWPRGLPYSRAASPAAKRASPPETRTEISHPRPTADPISLSPSPPTAVRSSSLPPAMGPRRLWLRSLAATSAQPLAGTEGATAPFWSPDSRSVGFFADSKLKRLDIGGGAPQTLAPAAAGRGGAWNADGVDPICVNSGTRPLFRVPASVEAKRWRVTELPTSNRATGFPFSCPMAANSCSTRARDAGNCGDLPGVARLDRFHAAANAV